MPPTNNFGNPKTRVSSRRWIWVVFSYAIAGACLYWVFHDLDFSQVLHSIVEVDWWYVALAAILALSVYLCAGWEWQLLLRPVGRLSLLKATQAIFAGRFANDVLPVHAGYVVRLYLVSRWANITIPAVLPSLLIERLFDSLWLAVCIAITVLFFPLPQQFVRTGEALGGVILFGAVAIAWIILRQRKASAAGEQKVASRWKIVQKVHSWAGQVAQGLQRIGTSTLLWTAVGLSLLKLLLQCLAFLSLLRAYDFSFSLWVRLGVFLVAYIGISLPSTPASVGVFQLFCVAVLQYFGIPKSIAGAFALLAFVVLTLPLSIGGFFAVTHTGLTWRQIRSEVAK